MDQSQTFARHFARLVSLLLHEPESIEEQKTALHAVVSSASEGSVTLRVREWRLEANGAPLPGSMAAADHTAVQLASHGIRCVHVSQGAAAADLLGFARILAADAPPASARGATEKRVMALGARTIDVEFGTTDTADIPAAAELLDRLAAATTAEAATTVLDELLIFAEVAAREGRPDEVATVLESVVRQERRAASPEITRAYVLALRRMARPVLLRCITALLDTDDARAADLVPVLARAGQDGAEAVIEQIAQSSTAEHRTRYLNVLRQLDAAVPALEQMLRDPRWFVARSAAELLGELHASSSADGIAPLLRHVDDRVRRAATNALVALGSADVLGAALESEPDAQAKLAIVDALARVPDDSSVQRLAKLAEPDGRIFRRKPATLRIAAVQALARLGTPEARRALEALRGDRERAVREAVSRALSAQ